MALSFTLTDFWDDSRRLHVIGSIAASGSYSTGGDTLDLSTAALQSLSPPIGGAVEVEGDAGFDYRWVSGTTLANGKVKIFQTGAALSGPLAELAAGAYPAAITGDAIAFKAVFKKFQ